LTITYNISTQKKDNQSYSRQCRRLWRQAAMAFSDRKQ